MCIKKRIANGHRTYFFYRICKTWKLLTDLLCTRCWKTENKHINVMRFNVWYLEYSRVCCLITVNRDNAVKERHFLCPFNGDCSYLAVDLFTGIQSVAKQPSKKTFFFYFNNLAAATWADWSIFIKKKTNSTVLFKLNEILCE